MTRYYKETPEDHKGTPENQLHCVVCVSQSGRFFDTFWRIDYQCTRKRGHGPDGEYCKQHAAMLAAGRKLFVPEHRGERKEK